MKKIYIFICMINHNDVCNNVKLSLYLVQLILYTSIDDIET